MNAMMTVPPPLPLPPSAIAGALENGGQAGRQSVDVFLDGDTSSEEEASKTDSEMPDLQESQSSAAESSDSESSVEEPLEQGVSKGLTPSMFFFAMQKAMKGDPEFREHMRREGVKDPLLCPELGLTTEELRRRLDLPATPRQTPQHATPQLAAMSAPKRKKRGSPAPPMSRATPG